MTAVAGPGQRPHRNDPGPADRRQPGTDLEAATEPRSGPRRDWRDSVRTAGDLAILGAAVTLAALPVVTAGAAVATASTVIRHFVDDDRWPSARSTWSTFRRRLVSGLPAGPLALVLAALIAVDVAGLRRGLVPGGPFVLTAVLVIAALAAGYAAIVAVLAGSGPGAVRAAAKAATGHPALLFAATGVVAVATVLALAVHPVLVLILPGYLLYALHAVTARLLPDRTA